MGAVSVGYAHIKVHSYSTHTHVAITLDPEAIYSIEPIQKEKQVVGLRLNLLNLPASTTPQSVSFADSRTTKIASEKTQNGLVYSFYFSQAAQSQSVDYFNYRTKSPSQFFLDYWMKPKAIKTTVPVKSAKIEHKKHVKYVLKKKKIYPETKSEIDFAGCGQVLNPEINGFAFWKANHKPYDYRSFFNLELPDTGYVYPKVATKSHERNQDGHATKSNERNQDGGARRSKEVAHYQLAVKLYKQSQYTLTLRTIEFFENSYPNSELRGELGFLKANALVQISRILKTDRYWDQAIEMYRQLILEAPDSERAKVSLAFLVQEFMARDDFVRALEYTLLCADKQKGLTASVCRLAAGETLFSLGEYDRAERAYQAVIDQENELSKEAAFRIGEVYFVKQFWERVIFALEGALKKYPKDALKFSPIWFNLAEAYFRSKNYSEAEKWYQQYLANFPVDKTAWAAELRLVELKQLQLKKPDAKTHGRIHAEYEGIINRHPYAPGAWMAELRLSECHRNLRTDPMKEFFIDFFQNQEIHHYGHPLVDLQQVRVWIDLDEAKFHLLGKEYAKALKKVEDYRFKLKGLALQDSFLKTYSAATAGLVEQYSNNNEESKVLETVEKFNSFLQNPTPFLVGLAIAKAYLGEGKLKDAQAKLAQLEKQLHQATGFEPDDLQNLTQYRDKFHLIKGRYARTVGESSEVISKEFQSMSMEGPLLPFKYDELAQTAHDSRKWSQVIEQDSYSLNHKLEKSFLIPKQVSIYLRYLESLMRVGKYSEVVKRADEVLLRYGAYTENTQDFLKVRELRAKALVQTNKYSAALLAIDEILQSAPQHPRLGEFEFDRAKILVKIGRKNEAFETFRKLAQASTDDVWKKSAQAELDQLQWDKKVAETLTGGVAAGALPGRESDNRK